MNTIIALKQLKFHYSTDDAEFFTDGNGAPSQQINLDNVNCTGEEARIDQCKHNGWRIDDCSHSEDVGIKCYGKYVGMLLYIRVYNDLLI